MLPCDGSDSQRLHMDGLLPAAAMEVQPDPPQPPLAVTYDVGGRLEFASAVHAAGFGIGHVGGQMVYVDPAADFFAEFAIAIDAEYDYLLSAVYIAGLPDAGVDVLLDGAPAGQIGLPPTGTMDIVHFGEVSQRTPALKLHIAPGTHTLRVANRGDAVPFAIQYMFLWSPEAVLPHYGEVHDLAPDAPTTIALATVSDAWRSTLSGAGLPGERWACNWSTCHIEYSVRIASAAAVDLSYLYNTQAADTGSIIRLNGERVADTVYVADTDTSTYHATAPIPLSLRAGVNRIRIEFGAVLVNGHLSGHYATRDVTFTPH